MRKICSSIFLGNFVTFFALRLTLRSLLSSSSFKEDLNSFNQTLLFQFNRSQMQEQRPVNPSGLFQGWLWHSATGSASFLYPVSKPAGLTPDKKSYEPQTTPDWRYRANPEQCAFVSFSMISSSRARLWFFSLLKSLCQKIKVYLTRTWNWHPNLDLQPEPLLALPIYAWD